MADETQDTTPAVEVTANALQPAPLYRLSPLQAGLLYGGAASTVMGPLGLLVGAGVGIATKLQRDNALDHRARQINDVVSETQALHSQAADMMTNADPATQKFLQEQMRLGSEGMTQFINEADPAGRVKMQNANVALAGVLSAQMQQARDSANAQETAKRSLVTSSAETYRNQFQTNQDNWRTINTQADKILDLTSAKDFDPNKAVNKGLIVGMLTTGIGLYRDNPADYTDAVTQGVQGLGKLPGVAGTVGGIAGDVIGGIMTAIKGEHYQLTTDDYRRLALNMKNFATKDAQQKADQLSQQGQALDAQARKWGVFDDKTDLAGYISGGVKTLPVTAVPQLQAAPTPSQLLPSTSNPTNQPRTAPAARNIGSPSILGGRSIGTWAGQSQSAASTARDNIMAAGLSEGTPRPTN